MKNERQKSTITELTKSLGQRLKLLRGDRTTKELSAIFATTKKSPKDKSDGDLWRNWEDGCVPWFAYDTLVRIADYFGVSTDWLLGRGAHEEHMRSTIATLSKLLTAQ